MDYSFESIIDFLEGILNTIDGYYYEDDEDYQEYNYNQDWYNSYEDNYEDNYYYSYQEESYTNFEYSKACKILGVNENDDFNTMKKARNKLIMKYHPDKNQDNLEFAEKKIKEINEAWIVIEKNHKQ